MKFYNKVYIGHVETINTNAYGKESIVESKVLALRLVGFDNVNKIPKFKPLRKYSEYYKLLSVEKIDGFVSTGMINKALKNTGKEEVKILKKVV